MAHDDTRRSFEDTQAIPDHLPHGSAVQTDFSEAEQERFWEDDKAAATAVVGLLAGIFTIGLIGYVVVALWVHASSNYWSA